MVFNWYPQNRNELNKVLNQFIKRKNNKKINGIIVPHAGYEYSGEVAGKGFTYLKKKNIKKAIVIGPSHYVYLNDVLTSNKKSWKTPLGEIKLFNQDFFQGDIGMEHSIKNQIPFLQKLGIKEILPLMVGKISLEKAEEVAKKISKIKAVYIFSTDLSHFLTDEEAVKKDKKTIKIIENLDLDNIKEIDACGTYPLLILFYLCKIKKTKPKLIGYKNSGHITGDKSAVVGYASLYF